MLRPRCLVADGVYGTPLSDSMQRPLPTPRGHVSLAKASFRLMWGSKKSAQGVFLLQGTPGGGSPNATSVHRFPATKSGWNGKTEEKHQYTVYIRTMET